MVLGLPCEEDGDEITLEDLSGCALFPCLRGLLPPNQSSRGQSTEGPHVVTALLVEMLVSSRGLGIPQVPGLFSFTHNHREGLWWPCQRQEDQGGDTGINTLPTGRKMVNSGTRCPQQRAGVPGSVKDPFRCLLVPLDLETNDLEVLTGP